MTDPDRADGVLTIAVMDAVNAGVKAWDSDLFIPLSVRFDIARRVLADERLADRCRDLSCTCNQEVTR